MQKIIINPSIAVELDIGPISVSERVTIRFNADADWTGDFELLIFNSIAKNLKIKPDNALVVNDKVMTLIVDPTAQGLADKTHFFEIVEKRAKRIVFKGNLNITK